MSQTENKNITIYHSLMRDEIESSSDDRKRMIYSVRDCIKYNCPRNKIVIMIGALLSNCSSEFSSGVEDLLGHHHDLTDDQHAEFWSFVSGQIDKLKDV